MTQTILGFKFFFEGIDFNEITNNLHGKDQ